MVKKVTFIHDESDTLHFNVIKEKVAEELKHLPGKRKTYAKIRAIFFPLLYVAIYILSTRFYDSPLIFFLLYGLMGLTDSACVSEHGA